ncbi:MAG: hypothetical protein NT062_15950 [Proteobacteria bacterium]|nr:hypothetical protein [Pseudomonadota bacterium]
MHAAQSNVHSVERTIDSHGEGSSVSSGRSRLSNDRLRRTRIAEEAGHAVLLLRDVEIDGTPLRENDAFDSTAGTLHVTSELGARLFVIEVPDPATFTQPPSS